MQFIIVFVFVYCHAFRSITNQLCFKCNCIFKLYWLVCHHYTELHTNKTVLKTLKRNIKRTYVSTCNHFDHLTNILLLFQNYYFS